MKILGIGKKPEETTWGHLEIKLKEDINFDPWGKQQEPIEVKNIGFYSTGPIFHEQRRPLYHGQQGDKSGG